MSRLISVIIVVVCVVVLVVGRIFISKEVCRTIWSNYKVWRQARKENKALCAVVSESCKRSSREATYKVVAQGEYFAIVE
jgi:hypothetical protein